MSERDFWEGYVPEPVKPRGEATLAQQEPVAYLCEPDENGLYGLPLTEKTCTKCFPVYRHPQRTWVGLMRGVRVEGDTVVITVKGGNDEARCLCGELISEMEKKT